MVEEFDDLTSVVLPRLSVIVPVLNEAAVIELSLGQSTHTT